MSNLDIIKTYHTKIWVDKDITAVDDFFANDANISSPLKVTKGLDDMKNIITAWHKGFPNLTVHWDEYICEGDKVVCRWRSTGKQEGEFLGKNPGNKSVNYSGVTIYHLQDNKVINYWAMVDMQTLNQQLS